MKYLTECDTQYDIIYLSVTAEGDSDYSDSVQKNSSYKLIKKVLSPDGIAALSLVEFSPSSYSKYRDRIQAVEQWFDFVHPFYVGLPSFGSNWGFVLGCDVKREYVERLNIGQLRFYSHDEDNYLFHLPKYLK